MFICCECCVLSGRGLCDELITRPIESYRMWCVVGCDLETPQRMPNPTQSCRAGDDDDDGVFNPRSHSRGTRRPRSPRPVLNINYIIKQIEICSLLSKLFLNSGVLKSLSPGRRGDYILYSST